MIHQDVELEKLRLVEVFLEDDSDNRLANDAFDAELEQAVAATEKSKLRCIRAVFEREKDVLWQASLDNARLLFGKSDAL